MCRSDRVAAADLPIVMGQAQAHAIAESWLRDVWSARERASFALPPSRLALEASDVITLNGGDRDYRLRFVETRDASFKTIDARSIEPHVFDAIVAPEREEEPDIVSVYGPTSAMFLDLPLLRGDEAPQTGYVAANANPWPGTVAFYRSPSTSGYELNTLAGAEAVSGLSLFDFYSGPLYRFDRSNDLYVKLAFGELASVTEEALLNGANYAALQNADGTWELLQFQTAELIDTSTYKLSDLLRGQGGTESAMRNPVAAGARFVLINSAVTAVNLRPDEVGLALNYKFGPVSETLDDLSYGSASHAFQGLGLRPLSAGASARQA